ncbi:MAG: alginate export family protein [Lewinellaceae bacterium]|nr:alginate export family protein [Saprospiraceae bacterium]MCB9339576.1 alginate export family protein [Lewinellaceae bacterium]
MKKLLGTCLLLLTAWTLLRAQDSLSSAPDFPPFRLVRSEEDFSFLKKLLPPGSRWEELKYLPLGENSYLSLGGDVRSEFQVLQNENWENGNDDAALFQRFMLHSDWHVGKNLRLFGQLKSGHAFGRNGGPFFLNDDDLDLHQLFVGLKLGNSTLEIGRQELRYGSQRLISLREGTNVRQSFDGARWIWRQPNLRLDLLFYAYNPQQVGVFDNKINTDQLLWGAYWVWDLPGADGLHFDSYYLGVHNEHPRFEQGSLQETRHSAGMRHWGETGPLSYNNEAVVQWGKFGSGNIRAWTLSTEMNYRLPGNWQPTPGLKAEIISGDRDPGDANLQTFNALYPRGGYFGLLALIGPANLMDVHPSLALTFGKKWNLNLDWDFFWRHRLTDGIYLPSGRLNLAGNGSGERFIGHQPGAQLAFVPNRFLEAEASYFYFFTGEFLDDLTPGANFSQIGVSLSFKF